MTRHHPRNWPMLLLLLIGMVLLFSPILFTDKIVRAPDILNEFYWGVYDAYGKPLWSLLRIDLSHAGWNPYINSGHTNDGGMASMQFLYPYRLVFGLIPAPASVAWFMVLHLFAGGAGLYCYCRLVGCTRWASLCGAVVFALCTEQVSLINAGHVMKIATIAYVPWVFYCLENGFRTQRWLPYLGAGLVLAFQFFNTHWQIAYYTCLGVAVYVVVRLMSGFATGEPRRDTARILLMSGVMTLFFLGSAAISLAPLVGWSKDTNRGVHSGANQGKGGLKRDEAMMWSLPPEEVAALVIPGLFGLSRQEGGDRPRPDQTYYWGRMVFTQTASYFGLLPWLMLPLPLLFRRDRITLAALLAVVGGLLFAMGKYTPFYQLLYDYLPGVSRFRVPKMILFMTALGLAVLTARAVDLLRDPAVTASPRLRRWGWWVLAFPVVLVLALAVEQLFGAPIREWLMPLLARPTRYQSGVQLVAQRWLAVERETGLALALASACSLVLWWMVRRTERAVWGTLLLMALLIGDLWRVNRQFLVLTDPPDRTPATVSPAIEWIGSHLKGGGNNVPEYRVLLLGDGDPMRYVAAGIPVLFTSNAVQKRRWQEYLDTFSVQSSQVDLMNVRWLVYDEKLFERDRSYFGDRYVPVFSGGGEVVLENRQVLPKAWLVRDVELVPDAAQRLKRLQDPAFKPFHTALVETLPVLPLVSNGVAGNVALQTYQAERIVVTAETAANSLLVLGEKFQSGWKAFLDGAPATIVPVDHILRGVYLPPGTHTVEFRFDPTPFTFGKWLTFSSFVVFMTVAVCTWWQRSRKHDRR